MKHFIIIAIILLASSCQQKEPKKYQTLPPSRYEKVRPPVNLPDHSTYEQR
jgi:hypothetical protein